jgi:hypothetical protein
MYPIVALVSMQVRLGVSHAAVLCSGRLFVHAIEQAPQQHESAASATRVLPVSDDAPKVTCMAIAGDFLFYGLGGDASGTGGSVEVFSLSDWAELPSCRHRTERPPKGVFPNALGTRVVVVDSAGTGELYNPVDTHSLPIPGFPTSTTRVLWDLADRNVFATWAPAGDAGSGAAAGKGSGLGTAGGSLATFLYTPVSLTGAAVGQLGQLDVQPNGDMVSSYRRQ